MGGIPTLMAMDQQVEMRDEGPNEIEEGKMISHPHHISQSSNPKFHFIKYISKPQIQPFGLIIELKIGGSQLFMGEYLKTFDQPLKKSKVFVEII